MASDIFSQPECKGLAFSWRSQTCESQKVKGPVFTKDGLTAASVLNTVCHIWIGITQHSTSFLRGAASWWCCEGLGGFCSRSACWWFQDSCKQLLKDQRCKLNKNIPRLWSYSGFSSSSGNSLQKGSRGMHVSSMPVSVSLETSVMAFAETISWVGFIWSMHICFSLLYFAASYCSLWSASEATSTQLERLLGQWSCSHAVFRTKLVSSQSGMWTWVLLWKEVCWDIFIKYGAFGSRRGLRVESYSLKSVVSFSFFFFRDIPDLLLASQLLFLSLQ